MTMGEFVNAMNSNRFFGVPELDEARASVQFHARNLMARHHGVFIGGDHSVRHAWCAGV